MAITANKSSGVAGIDGTLSAALTTLMNLATLTSLIILTKIYCFEDVDISINSDRLLSQMGIPPAGFAVLSISAPP